MRKIALASLLLITVSGYSQLSGGIKGGGMFTKLYFDKRVPDKGNPEFHGYLSAFLDYTFNKIAPEIEVSYSKMGTDIYNIGQVTYIGDCRIYVGKRVSLKFGFFFSSLLSVDQTITGVYPQKDKKVDVSQGWETDDTGVVFGFNLGISKHLLMDGGFMLGMTDIKLSPGVQSRCIRLGLGYRIR